MPVDLFIGEEVNFQDQSFPNCINSMLPRYAPKLLSSYLIEK
jgi:hypothetical protein